MASLSPISTIDSLSITTNVDLEYSSLVERISKEIKDGNLSGILEIFNTSHPEIEILQQYEFQYEFLSYAYRYNAPEIADFLYEKGLRASWKEIFESCRDSRSEVCINLFKYKDHLHLGEIHHILIEAIRYKKTVLAQEIISSQPLCPSYFSAIIKFPPPLDLLEQIIKKIGPQNISIDFFVDSEELFLFLLKQGISWDRYTLERAAKKGYNQAIKELRQNNCPFYGNELGIAAKHNHAETVALLIKEKAPHNLHTIPDALESKNPEIMKALMTYGAPMTGCLKKYLTVVDLDTILFVLNLGYKPHRSEFVEFGNCYSLLMKDRTLIQLAKIPEFGEHCIKFFKYFDRTQQTKFLDIIPKYTSISIDYIIAELKSNYNAEKLADLDYCISKGATLKKRHLTSALTNLTSINFDLALHLINLGCPLSVEHLEKLCVFNLFVTKGSEEKVFQMCQLFVRLGIKPSLLCLETAFQSSCKNLVELLVDYDAPLKEFLVNKIKSNKGVLDDLVINHLHKYIQSCLPFELRNEFTVDNVKSLIHFHDKGYKWIETNFTKLFTLIIKSKEDYQLTFEQAFLVHIFPNDSLKWRYYFCNPHLNLPNSYQSPFMFNEDVFFEILEFASTCKGGIELINTVYSFTILFGNVEEVKQFIQKKSSTLDENCVFKIPKKGTWDTKIWKEWIFAVPEEESHRKKLLPWAPKLETVIFGRLPRANTSDSIEEQCTFYRQAIIELINCDPRYQQGLSDLWKEQALTSNESNQKLDTFLLNRCRDFFPVDWNRYVRREKINNNENLPHLSGFLKALVRNRTISLFDFNEMSELLAYKLAPESAEKYMDIAYSVAKNEDHRSILKTAVKILTVPKGSNLLPEVDFCYEDYHFYKLATDDPLILKMANIHLLSKASSCYIYHKFSSKLGFYALKRNNEVVAVAQGAIGPNNDFHFESQIKDKVNENIIFKVFQKEAKRIIEQNTFINRVLASVDDFPNCETDERDFFKQRMFGKLLDTHHCHVLSKSSAFPPALIQIKQSDLTIRQGIRRGGVILKCNEMVESLSVNPIKRNVFLQEHPRANELLMKHIRNPLIEEGEAHTGERKGELFLTSEAIIKLFRNKYSESPFDLIESNGFFYELLIQRLKAISIHENKPLAILFDNEGEIFTAYIRKANDHYQCYLFHPQKKFPEHLKEVLRNHFNNIEFIRMKGRLLNDFSNMGTMAYQSLKFYAKYGVDIFNQRIKGVHPYLLKLTQDHKPEPEAMKAVFSRKTWTLQNYLTNHTKEYNGKFHNTAAQIKKYKLISKLELLLQAELD